MEGKCISVVLCLVEACFKYFTTRRISSSPRASRRCHYLYIFQDWTDFSLQNNRSYFDWQFHQEPTSSTFGMLAAHLSQPTIELSYRLSACCRYCPCLKKCILLSLNRLLPSLNSRYLMCHEILSVPSQRIYKR